MLVKRLVYSQPLLEKIYCLDYHMMMNGTDQLCMLVLLKR